MFVCLLYVTLSEPFQKVHVAKHTEPACHERTEWETTNTSVKPRIVNISFFLIIVKTVRSRCLLIVDFLAGKEWEKQAVREEEWYCPGVTASWICRLVGSWVPLGLWRCKVCSSQLCREQALAWWRFCFRYNIQVNSVFLQMVTSGPHYQLSTAFMKAGFESGRCDHCGPKNVTSIFNTIVSQSLYKSFCKSFFNLLWVYSWFPDSRLQQTMWLNDGQGTWENDSSLWLY